MRNIIKFQDIITADDLLVRWSIRSLQKLDDLFFDELCAYRLHASREDEHGVVTHYCSIIEKTRGEVDFFIEEFRYFRLESIVFNMEEVRRFEAEHAFLLQKEVVGEDCGGIVYDRLYDNIIYGSRLRIILEMSLYEFVELVNKYKICCYEVYYEQDKRSGRDTKRKKIRCKNYAESDFKIDEVEDFFFHMNDLRKVEAPELAALFEKINKPSQGVNCHVESEGDANVQIQNDHSRHDGPQRKPNTLAIEDNTAKRWKERLEVAVRLAFDLAGRKKTVTDEWLKRFIENNKKYELIRGDAFKAFRSGMPESMKGRGPRT